MKYFLYVIGGVFCIGILWWFFGGGYDVAKPTAGTNIIIFGDSLVEGVGASEGGDVATQLSERLELEVINAGVSGDTTAEAMERIEEDVLDRDPKVVVIILGGNDALQRVSPDETFSNLEVMIRSIQKRGAGVVLVGIRGGLSQAVYKERFPELAKQTNAAYIPDILKGVFGDRELMSDAVHPNEKGYAIFVDKIEPVLREMLDE